MTALTIQVPAVIESKLRAQAEKQGKDIPAVALEILEKGLVEPSPPTEARQPGPQDLSYEEWSAQFRAWAANHPRVDVIVDDSRESIYEGRGE